MSAPFYTETVASLRRKLAAKEVTPVEVAQDLERFGIIVESL